MEFRNAAGEVYCRISFFPDNTYVYLRWYGVFISAEDIIRAGLWELDECEKRGVTRIINDNTELHGSWDHVNDWNENVWLPRALGMGMNRLAHVVSQNIFEKLSADEMQLIFAEKIDVRMFQDFASAEQWTLNPD